MFLRDFFLDKQREKAKLEAELKLQVTLKQLIPAGEAKPVAPLGVILSQYYLNLTEFCADFNKKTDSWEPGVMLPVVVKKGLRAKDYKLIIKTPTMSFLIDNSFDENGKLDYLSLWDIVNFNNKINYLPEKKIAQSLFSSLIVFPFSSYNF